MGVDQNTGAIVVGDYIRAGQTVQFHVRDAATAVPGTARSRSGGGDARGGAEGAPAGLTWSTTGARPGGGDDHEGRPGTPAGGDPRTGGAVGPADEVGGEGHRPAGVSTSSPPR